MTAPMSDAEEKLYFRVVDALSAHDATPQERQQILDGTGPAESWEEVPKDVQDIIVRIEGTPRQVWDDPADTPRQQNI